MKLLLTGPQGAGKTTVGELVARRWERGVHVDGDVFRRFVLAGRAEMSEHATDEALAQLRLRYELAAHAARAYEAAGFDVVVSDVVAGALLAELAPQYDRVVVLFPREDAIAVRHAPWVYRLYADQTERLGEWLDTSDLTPEQTAAAILRS
jgi:cytidylate kinase